jgi:hypothetical protein
MGLQKQDFVILEDGTPQESALLTLGDDARRPRSIVLVLEWSNTAHTVAESVKAAATFVGQLLPLDRVAIVAGNLKLICDFTSDKSELIFKLRGLEEQARHGPRGLPAQQLEFETLFAVLQELIDRESDQPIIVFQGDAGEAVYLRDQFDADHPRSPSTKRQIGLADFELLIEKKYATIYPILTWYYCFNKRMSDEEHAQMIRTYYHEHGWRFVFPVGYAVKVEKASGDAINRVAELSGGSVFCLEVPLHRWTLWPQRRTNYSGDVLDRASLIYSQILSRINQRYIIGYYPTNRALDGKRRKVEIRVRNHPEYTVESRHYYYAPSDRTVNPDKPN